MVDPSTFNHQLSTGLAAADQGHHDACSFGNLQHRKRAVAPGDERGIRMLKQGGNDDGEMKQKTTIYGLPPPKGMVRRRHHFCSVSDILSPRIHCPSKR